MLRTFKSPTIEVIFFCPNLSTPYYSAHGRHCQIDSVLVLDKVYPGFVHVVCTSCCFESQKHSYVCKGQRQRSVCTKIIMMMASFMVSTSLFRLGVFYYWEVTTSPFFLIFPLRTISGQQCQIFLEDSTILTSKRSFLTAYVRAVYQKAPEVPGKLPRISK